MKEFVFLGELQKLHDFLVLFCGHRFVIDGCVFILVQVLGSPPRSKFLFERESHGYKITASLFEMYDGAVSGRILPEDEVLKGKLKEILLSYPYLNKSQERKIETWS